MDARPSHADAKPSASYRDKSGICNLWPPSANIWNFADAIWSTCSSWSFSNCGSVFTRGAAQPPQMTL